MKKLLFRLRFLLLLASLSFFSCHKPGNERCADNNRPPIANAGPDQVISLPKNNVLLNGSSHDPDGNITSYDWIKISGPSLFNIAKATSVLTQVSDLVEGIYLFQITINDGCGLVSKDTVQITVNPGSTALCDPTNRPVVSAQLMPVGGGLSLARSAISAVSAGNKLFFAGGYNGSGDLSRVDIFDIPSQSWSSTELSVARSDVACVVSGDKVFFAGGFKSKTQDRTSRVDIYNLTTQTWTTAELSKPRNGIIAAAIGNKVFFAGGISEPEISSETVDIYDIPSNTWSTVNLSEPRVAFSATVADNKIYFAGGWNGTESSVASTKIDIYDNATNSWSVSALSKPRSFHAGIFRNGKIYWAGGATYIDWANGDTLTCEVEVRDVNTQVSSFTNLFRQAGYIDAFEKGDRIAYLPNTIGGPIAPIKFDIYDVPSNNWSIAALNQDMPYTSGVVSIGNTIYIAGGHTYSSTGPAQYHTDMWKLEF
ncbi:MAG TPA: kelch repeat-containing protein [Chitinophagaceae bacterium]|nr:kelch repeat-containing protein [Chitinophagaceae bacterium]